MTDDPVRTLSLAAAAVCATIPIGRVIDRLRAGENGAAGRLAALIQAEIPAFRQSRNAEAREDLGTEAALLTEEFVRLLEGGEMDASISRAGRGGAGRRRAFPWKRCCTASAWRRNSFSAGCARRARSMPP